MKIIQIKEIIDEFIRHKSTTRVKTKIYWKHQPRTEAFVELKKYYSKNLKKLDASSQCTEEVIRDITLLAEKYIKKYEEKNLAHKLLARLLEAIAQSHSSPARQQARAQITQNISSETIDRPGSEEQGAPVRKMPAMKPGSRIIRSSQAPRLPKTPVVYGSASEVRSGPGGRYQRLSMSPAATPGVRAFTPGSKSRLPSSANIPVVQIQTSVRSDSQTRAAKPSEVHDPSKQPPCNSAATKHKIDFQEDVSTARFRKFRPKPTVTTANINNMPQDIAAVAQATTNIIVSNTQPHLFEARHVELTVLALENTLNEFARKSDHREIILLRSVIEHLANKGITGETIIPVSDVCKIRRISELSLRHSGKAYQAIERVLRLTSYIAQRDEYKTLPFRKADLRYLHDYYVSHKKKLAKSSADFKSLATILHSAPVSGLADNDSLPETTLKELKSLAKKSIADHGSKTKRIMLRLDSLIHTNAIDQQLDQAQKPLTVGELENVVKAYRKHQGIKRRLSGTQKWPVQLKLVRQTIKSLRCRLLSNDEVPQEELAMLSVLSQSSLLSPKHLSHQLMTDFQRRLGVSDRQANTAARQGFTLDDVSDYLRYYRAKRGIWRKIFGNSWQYNHLETLYFKEMSGVSDFHAPLPQAATTELRALLFSSKAKDDKLSAQIFHDIDRRTVEFVPKIHVTLAKLELMQWIDKLERAAQSKKCSMAPRELSALKKILARTDVAGLPEEAQLPQRVVGLTSEIVNSNRHAFGDVAEILREFNIHLERQDDENTSKRRIQNAESNCQQSPGAVIEHMNNVFSNLDLDAPARKSNNLDWAVINAENLLLDENFEFPADRNALIMCRDNVFIEGTPVIPAKINVILLARKSILMDKGARLISSGEICCKATVIKLSGCIDTQFSAIANETITSDAIIGAKDLILSEVVEERTRLLDEHEIRYPQQRLDLKANKSIMLDGVMNAKQIILNACEGKIRIKGILRAKTLKVEPSNGHQLNFVIGPEAKIRVTNMIAKDSLSTQHGHQQTESSARQSSDSLTKLFSTVPEITKSAAKITLLGDMMAAHLYAQSAQFNITVQGILYCPNAFQMMVNEALFSGYLKSGETVFKANTEIMVNPGAITCFTGQLLMSQPCLQLYAPVKAQGYLYCDTDTFFQLHNAELRVLGGLYIRSESVHLLAQSTVEKEILIEAKESVVFDSMAYLASQQDCDIRAGTLKLLGTIRSKRDSKIMATESLVCDENSTIESTEGQIFLHSNTVDAFGKLKAAENISVIADKSFLTNNASDICADGKIYFESPLFHQYGALVTKGMLHIQSKGDLGFHSEMTADAGLSISAFGEVVYFQGSKLLTNGDWIVKSKMFLNSGCQYVEGNTFVNVHKNVSYRESALTKSGDDIVIQANSMRMNGLLQAGKNISVAMNKRFVIRKKKKRSHEGDNRVLAQMKAKKIGIVAPVSINLFGYIVANEYLNQSFLHVHFAPSRINSFRIKTLINASVPLNIPRISNIKQKAGVVASAVKGLVGKNKIKQLRIVSHPPSFEDKKGVEESSWFLLIVHADAFHIAFRKRHQGYAEHSINMTQDENRVWVESLSIDAASCDGQIIFDSSKLKFASNLVKSFGGSISKNSQTKKQLGAMVKGIFSLRLNTVSHVVQMMSQVTVLVNGFFGTLVTVVAKTAKLCANSVSMIKKIKNLRPNADRLELRDLVPIITDGANLLVSGFFLALDSARFARMIGEKFRLVKAPSLTLDIPSGTRIGHPEFNRNDRMFDYVYSSTTSVAALADNFNWESLFKVNPIDYKQLFLALLPTVMAPVLPNYSESSLCSLNLAGFNLTGLSNTMTLVNFNSPLRVDDFALFRSLRSLYSTGSHYGIALNSSDDSAVIDYGREGIVVLGTYGKRAYYLKDGYFSRVIGPGSVRLEAEHSNVRGRYQSNTVILSLKDEADLNAILQQQGQYEGIDPKKQLIVEFNFGFCFNEDIDRDCSIFISLPRAVVDAALHSGSNLTIITTRGDLDLLVGSKVTAGKNVTLLSASDLNKTKATVEAGETFFESAQGNINNILTMNSAKVIRSFAKVDIVNQGGTYQAQTVLDMRAGHDVINEVGLDENKTFWWKSKKHVRGKLLGGRGNRMSQGVGVRICAGNKIIIKGSEVGATGRVILSGDNGVEITATPKPPLVRMSSKLHHASSYAYQQQLQGSNLYSRKSRVDMYAKKGSIHLSASRLDAFAGVAMICADAPVIDSIKIQSMAYSKHSSIAGMHKREEHHESVVTTVINTPHLFIKFKHGDVVFTDLQGEIGRMDINPGKDSQILFNRTTLNHSVRDHRSGLNLQVGPFRLFHNGTAQKTKIWDINSSSVASNVNNFANSSSSLEAAVNGANCFFAGLRLGNQLLNLPWSQVLFGQCGLGANYLPKIQIGYGCETTDSNYQDLAPANLRIGILNIAGGKDLVFNNAASAVIGKLVLNNSGSLIQNGAVLTYQNSESGYAFGLSFQPSLAMPFYLPGSMSADFSYSQNATDGSFVVPSQLVVGEVQYGKCHNHILNDGYFHVGKAVGHTDIELITTPGNESYTGFSVGISTAGSLSGSIWNGNSQTVNVPSTYEVDDALSLEVGILRSVGGKVSGEGSGDIHPAQFTSIPVQTGSEGSSFGFSVNFFASSSNSQLGDVFGNVHFSENVQRFQVASLMSSTGFTYEERCLENNCYNISFDLPMVPSGNQMSQPSDVATMPNTQHAEQVDEREDDQYTGVYDPQRYIDDLSVMTDSTSAPDVSSVSKLQSSYSPVMTNDTSEAGSSTDAIEEGAMTMAPCLLQDQQDLLETLQQAYLLGLAYSRNQQQAYQEAAQAYLDSSLLHKLWVGLQDAAYEDQHSQHLTWLARTKKYLGGYMLLAGACGCYDAAMGTAATFFGPLFFGSTGAYLAAEGATMLHEAGTGERAAVSFAHQGLQYLGFSDNTAENITSIMDYALLAEGGFFGSRALLGAGLGRKLEQFGLLSPGVRMQASMPAELHWGVGALSARQEALLQSLPQSGDYIMIGSSDISMRDLASLTAYTGDEFAVFTLGGRRMVFRGEENKLIINRQMAAKLQSEGWTWSAHTHNGTSDLSLLPSGRPGDRSVLELFGQERSMILNSAGRRSIFDLQTEYLISNSVETMPTNKL